MVSVTCRLYPRIYEKTSTALFVVRRINFSLYSQTQLRINKNGCWMASWNGILRVPQYSWQKIELTDRDSLIKILLFLLSFPTLRRCALVCNSNCRGTDALTKNGKMYLNREDNTNESPVRFICLKCPEVKFYKKLRRVKRCVIEKKRNHKKKFRSGRYVNWKEGIFPSLQYDLFLYENTPRQKWPPTVKFQRWLLWYQIFFFN